MWGVGGNKNYTTPCGCSPLARHLLGKSDLEGIPRVVPWWGEGKKRSCCANHNKIYYNIIIIREEEDSKKMMMENIDDD